MRLGTYGNVINEKFDVTDIYTQHHLLKSLNGDMILYFKFGNKGPLSGCALCFHFTHRSLSCGYDRNCDGLSLHLTPTLVISLGLLFYRKRMS